MLTLRAELGEFRVAASRAARPRPPRSSGSSSFSPRNRPSAPCTICDISSRSAAKRARNSSFSMDSARRRRRVSVVRRSCDMAATHTRAAFQIAAQPLLHRVERARRPAQLARALLGERRMLAPRPTASAAFASSRSGRVMVRAITNSATPSSTVSTPSSTKICARQWRRRQRRERADTSPARRLAASP